jgi:hypothetical protein
MRTNFLPFASGARNSIYLQRSSKSLPTTNMLDQKEEEFIADVYEVLQASHYTLLTKEEWELATRENFNLNLPMEVNWEYMDPELLKNFWQSSPERQAIRANLPDCMAVSEGNACQGSLLAKPTMMLAEGYEHNSVRPNLKALTAVAYCSTASTLCRHFVTAVKCTASSPLPWKMLMCLSCCILQAPTQAIDSTSSPLVTVMPISLHLVDTPSNILQDRILVFHRGIGTEKLSGLLIDQKLDLLMDYTVFNLLDKLRQPLEGLLAKIGLLKKKTEEEEKVGMRSGVLKIVLLVYRIV